MRVIHTSLHVPLSAVKPLDDLLEYRRFCLAATTQALQRGARVRQRSPVDGTPLVPFGAVDGFSYVRCPSTGSLFLERVAEDGAWAELLFAVSRYRQSPDGVHARIARSRTDTVYVPKLEWMADTLRLHGVASPRVIEVVTPPSPFTLLLQTSGLVADVRVVEEMALMRAAGPFAEPVEAAILLESLDRVTDPPALLRGVYDRLAAGGLIFLTAMVASGFDVAVLGVRNTYLFPPDRANCFSVAALRQLLVQPGFELLEASTPGVLDVEIVQAHLRHEPSVPLSPFERQLLDADEETRQGFQAFLQQYGLSSFARLVGRKRS